MRRRVPTLATIPEDIDEFIPDRAEHREWVRQKMIQLIHLFKERMYQSRRFTALSVEDLVNLRERQIYSIYKSIRAMDVQIEQLQNWLIHEVNRSIPRKIIHKDPQLENDFLLAMSFTPNYKKENQVMQRFYNAMYWISP
jgi:hypothetical protein